MRLLQPGQPRRHLTAALAHRGGPRDGVHGPGGSYSPAKNADLPRSTLPVYRRQRFPDPLLGERFDGDGAARRFRFGNVFFVTVSFNPLS